MAQRSQAYLAVGAGAADRVVGGEWVIPNTRVGVGGELGAGLTLTRSLTGSLHLGTNPPSKVDPFVTVSLTSMGASGYDGQGLSAGVGLTYWPWRRVGIRAAAFRFWPVFNEEGSAEDLEEVGGRHFGLHGGITFGF